MRTDEAGETVQRSIGETVQRSIGVGFDIYIAPQWIDFILSYPALFSLPLPVCLYNIYATLQFII